MTFIDQDPTDVTDDTPDLVSGQGDSDIADGGSEPIPEQQPDDLLDPNLYGDYRVPVKVAGQEQLVPLRDIASGYMMQSDYTRKTQEIAAERERLAQADRLMMALQSDPQSTLKALQEAFVKNGGQFDGDDVDDFEELTPQEQQLKELADWKAAQEQRELDRYIDSQINELKQQYGEFNEADLLDFMVLHGINDFRHAYGALTFERQQARARADQQAGNAKRALPPIAGGRGVAAGAVSAGQDAPPQNVQEAFYAAQREHGLI